MTPSATITDNSNWIVAVAMLARFGITAVYAIVTLHTAEMFPTDIRNSALGTSSMFAHVGSIAAPYIVDFLVIIHFVFGFVLVF